MEKVEELVCGVELEEVFPRGLADGQEHADRRSAHQEHLGVEAAQHTTHRNATWVGYVVEAARPTTQKRIT